MADKTKTDEKSVSIDQTEKTSTHTGTQGTTTLGEELDTKSQETQADEGPDEASAKSKTGPVEPAKAEEKGAEQKAAPPPEAKVAAEKPKEEKKTRCQRFKIKSKAKAKAFRTFVYNKETHEFFGRTCSSWVKLLLFYLSLYSVLIFAVVGPCICVLLITLSGQFPKWYGYKSLVGDAPGLGMRPRFSDLSVNDKKGLKHMAFFYLDNKTDGPQGYEQYVENMVKTFKTDYARQKDSKVVECTAKSNPSIDDKTNLDASDLKKIKTSCKVDVFNSDPDDGLGPCSCVGTDCKKTKFGYDKGEPCVMLRVNQLIGWYPVSYPNSSFHELAVADYTEFVDKHGGPETVREHAAKNCWFRRLFVRCMPQWSLDEEKNVRLEYFPKHGIPFCYYPYVNLPGYEQPITMVKFSNLPEKDFVNFICKVLSYDTKIDAEQGNLDEFGQGQVMVGVYKNYYTKPNIPTPTPTPPNVTVSTQPTSPTANETNQTPTGSAATTTVIV